MRRNLRLGLLGALVLSWLPACALTNKADPLNLRYFAPYTPQSKQHPTTATSPDVVTVRIESVEAAAHLTELIAYRTSEPELAFYEDLRWTETPNVYLERAIGDALFADGTLRRGLTEGVYTLAVLLEAFDEIKYGEPRVRVVTRVWVGDERWVLSERRLIVEEPVANDSDSHAALVAAFTRALQKTALELRGQVDAVVAASRTSETVSVDDQANTAPQSGASEQVRSDERNSAEQ